MRFSPEYIEKKAEQWARRSTNELYVVDRTRTSYEALLPLHRGRTLSETIESRTRARMPVSILDAGCGEGQFLLGSLDRWKSKVRLTGVTSYPYPLDSSGVRAKIDSGEVEILVGNLDDFKRREAFDLIVSVYVVMYLFDPLSVLSNLYESLKDGGVGFIHPFTLKFGDENEESKLNDYLKQKYRFEFSSDRSMSFTKNSDTLDLPVEVSSIEQRYSASTSWQTVYKLRK